MHRLIEKAREEHSLDKDELIELLCGGEETDEELFAAADAVRRQYVGDGVHLRGLIEFSNFCRNNCRYCGLRRGNKKLERYRIEEDTIFELAEHAVRNMGLKTVVLQSGEDMFFTTEKLCAVIRRIKTLGAALTLSIGEKSLDEYKAYREAGADRFLLRIETTDKKLYLENDPGMSWEKRVECIKNLGRAGMEIGTGVLVGLPGQTVESYAGDILFFKQVNADMIEHGLESDGADPAFAAGHQHPRHHRDGNSGGKRSGQSAESRRQRHHAQRHPHPVPPALRTVPGQIDHRLQPRREPAGSQRQNRFAGAFCRRRSRFPRKKESPAVKRLAFPVKK